MIRLIVSRTFLQKATRYVLFENDATLGFRPFISTINTDHLLTDLLYDCLRQGDSADDPEGGDGGEGEDPPMSPEEPVRAAGLVCFGVTQFCFGSGMPRWAELFVSHAFGPFALLMNRRMRTTTTRMADQIPRKTW